MKKGLGVLLCGFLLAVCMPRPAGAGVTFDLGIKGGVSISKVVWTDEGLDDPSKPLAQPLFGVFAAFNLSQTFAIQPEVYLLTRGGKWTEEGVEITTDWVEKWKYIHIPILAKVRLKKEGKTIPIIFAGPAVDFNLSASGKIYEDDVLVDEYDFSEYVNSPTISAVVGAGTEMTMKKLVLIFDVRFEIGLSNPITLPDEKVQLGSLMVMLGLGF